MPPVRPPGAAYPAQVGSAGGREVEHIGDGIMAPVDDTARSAACAGAMLRALESFELARADRLRIRVGTRAGEPVDDSNDPLGVAVRGAVRMRSRGRRDDPGLGHGGGPAGRPRRPARTGSRPPEGFRDPMTVYGVAWR